MKQLLIVLIALVFAAVLVGGCTSVPATPATTLAPATVVPTTGTTMVQTPLFELGNSWVDRSFSFNSEKDVYIENFRVIDNQPWGIKFDITTLNDDLQYCWFVMKVTNIDTGNSDTYGYGRENGFEKNQSYPMYGSGPYKVEMSGNRVKVDVKIAERNP